MFGRIKATVSDAGGIMSHTAIVSREYGLPCIVGTGRGTQVIRTGDRVRVNGDTGVVTVLSRPDRGSAKYAFPEEEVTYLRR